MSALLVARPVLLAVELGELVGKTAGDPGTGRAMPRQGGLAPARPDQGERGTGQEDSVRT